MPIDRDSSTANLEQPLLQPAHGLQRVVSVSESGETEKSLASGSEPYTGGSYYIDFIKQFVKKFPRGESVRCFQPDVRSVFATIHPQAAAPEAFPHDTGVGHVVIDRFPDLCFSFRAVDCFGTSLHKDIIKGRIEHAAQLLLQTQMSVTDVAAACGYENLEHFSRQFKKYHGVAPSKFRR